MSNVRSTREKIHDLLVKKRFEGKGDEDFTSLSGEDIRAAFDLYDKMIFDGQLYQKLKESSATLNFFSKGRTSGLGGYCGLKRPKEEGRRIETEKIELDDIDEVSDMLGELTKDPDYEDALFLFTRSFFNIDEYFLKLESLLKGGEYDRIVWFEDADGEILGKGFEKFKRRELIRIEESLDNLSEKELFFLEGDDSPLCEYYIDIAPNVLEKRKKFQKEIRRVLGEYDRVYALLITLEHQIIHLLMVLWNYFDAENPEIYGSHGKLFWCMLKRYFEHGITFYDAKRLTDIDDIHLKPLGFGRPGLPINWEDSCYLDSLLVALLLGANDFYRRKIFDADVSKIDYTVPSPYAEGERVFKSVCTEGSKIQTLKKTRKLASKIQKQLKRDNAVIRGGEEDFYCTDIRALLRECLPKLGRKYGGGRIRYTSYNVVEVYDIIVGLFPMLKMKRIPTITKKPAAGAGRTSSFSASRGKEPVLSGGAGRTKAKLGEMNDVTLFQMWDFMSPEGEEGSYPIWDEVNTPVLVFQNGMVPAIKKFNSLKSEELKGWGPIPGKFKKVKRDGERVEVPKYGNVLIEYEKERAFDEYIIDERYRLFAVVMNEGSRPGLTSWGGGHYTAFVRIDDGEGADTGAKAWYEYDDFGPSWERLKKLPKAAFIDSRFSRPELFFYERINKL